MAEAVPVTGEKKKRGWPKGKPRKPKIEVQDTQDRKEKALPPVEVVAAMTVEDLARVQFATGGLSAWYDSVEKVALVMAKGMEVGLTPLQAIQQIIPADDGLTLTPEGMRALILERNLGAIVPVVMDDDECVVEAKRIIPGEVLKVRFSYSVAEAAKDGLFGRESWRSGKYRQGLLFGRATSKAARAMFPDIVRGLGYTTEELTNEAYTAPVSPKSSDDHQTTQGGPAPAPAPTVSEQSQPVREQAAPGARTLHHPIVIRDAKTGNEKTVLTAGIEKTTIFAIHDATKAGGGNANWRDAYEMGKQFLAERGVSDLKSLTEAEGQELLTLMFPLPEAFAPAPVTAKPDIWTAFLQKIGMTHREQDLLGLLASSAGKPKEQLSVLELENAVDDLMKLADDRQAFEIMLDRALQVAGMGG